MISPRPSPSRLASDWTIRCLKPEDSLEDLTTLLHAAYAQLAALGFRYAAVDQDVALTAKRVAQGTCLVAVSEGRLVGTVTVRPGGSDEGTPYTGQNDVYVFGQFGVLPDLQGGGLGRDLVAACERVAVDAGATRMALDTAEGVDHLVAWYGRLGYRFVDYVQWGHTNYRSVILEKALF